MHCAAMHCAALLLASVSWGLVAAQAYESAPEPAGGTRACLPDVCELLAEVGALRETLALVDARLRESERQIVELKSKEATQVIFSVAIGGEGRQIGPFQEDRTLIYKKVITNVGDAYSPATGFFVAPVAGVYYFTMFYHAGGGHPAALVLVRGGEPAVTTSDHRTASDGADNGGNAACLRLRRGDRVHVRMEALTTVWGNDAVTTFSGFLLSQG